jgi:hypothetical protein
MELRQAVATAKHHIATLFSDEGIADIGLEEIIANFDDTDPQDLRVWQITVGFTRAWDAPGALGVAAGLPRRRTYKIVDIADKDGRVLAVRNREMAKL